MKRYDKYKDSGVEWIGKIPEKWKIQRIKTLFKEINERSFDGSEDLLSVSQYTGVTKKSDKIGDGDLLTNASTLEGYKIVSKDDLVSNIMLAWNGSLGFSPYNGITSPAYSIYRLKSKEEKTFFHYLFRTEKYKAEFKRQSSGVIESRLRLYTDDFFSIYAILPTLPEQQAIASFLDDKTAKIDQTISIKEKEIELLKERRQILIQKAVTKGLDENVKFKDSGVEWIGEIPEHWEVRKLMGVCRFIRGNSPFGKDELLDEGEYVAIQYGKTYKVNEVNKEYGYYVNNEFYKKSQVVNYGDIILISTSETIDDLGHTVYYRRNDLGLLGGEQIMLKPKQEEINGQYLYFTSKVFSKELRKFATGIKVFRFNINDLKTIFTVLPPLSEQNEIANYIETKSTKISKAISLKQQEIEKLKEYKTVLIDNVVTGKVKVS
ncbi:restriction endonuclease subunit S [Empedobacter brevis]|uniref:restriction endonuclease subunit S n=1 Tax=Empedobacter brevis TaxID=247 RepID=UPI00123DA2E6|nr:restriction endonuclease subunit S [Empedobacter brevis]QES92286.1 restriction endonuclease subunit S [Empedobacter brevis]